MSIYELRTKLLVWGKCHRKTAGGPQSVLQVMNMDYGVSIFGGPYRLWASLSRFKVQGNFLLLCSYTNFAGYSFVYWIISRHVHDTVSGKIHNDPVLHKDPTKKRPQQNDQRIATLPNKRVKDVFYTTHDSESNKASSSKLITQKRPEKTIFLSITKWPSVHVEVWIVVEVFSSPTDVGNTCTFWLCPGFSFRSG